MTQFDLQKVLKGAPVTTVDNREVRILCTDALDNSASLPLCQIPHAPIVALVKSPDGSEKVGRYTEKGQLVFPQRASYCQVSADDLVMKTNKLHGFVNIIRGTQFDRFAGRVYATQEEALSFADEKWVATIPITWEEEGSKTEENECVSE